MHQTLGALGQASVAVFAGPWYSMLSTPLPGITVFRAYQVLDDNACTWQLCSDFAKQWHHPRGPNE